MYMVKERDEFRISGIEVVLREAKLYEKQTSCRVHVPIGWKGKKVKVVRIE